MFAGGGNCSHAPAGPSRVDCIEGAVQDRFREKSGTDDALAMCAMVENAAEQDACYGTIIARACHVLPTREELDGFCAGSVHGGAVGTSTP